MAVPTWVGTLIVRGQGAVSFRSRPQPHLLHRAGSSLLLGHYSINYYSSPHTVYITHNKQQCARISHR